MSQNKTQISTYERIYATIRQIPKGRVVTYGQIAQLAGGCTARMVGYALAALKDEQEVPWQRVINYHGKISPHGFGYGSAIQHELLVDEGIKFDNQDRIDLNKFGFIFD